MWHRCKLAFLLILGIVNFGFHPRECEGRYEIAGFNLTSTPTVTPANPFDAEGDAAVLYDAIESRNLSVIVNVLTKRVSWQRVAISEAYQTRYNDNLVEKLKPRFGDIVIALLTPLDEYYARELAVALRRRSRCKDIHLVGILCTLPPSKIRETRLSYANMTGRSIMEDSFSLAKNRQLIYEICVTNNTFGKVDDKDAADKARRLYLDLQEPDQVNPLIRLLLSNNPEQIRAIDIHFEKKVGRTIRSSINWEDSVRLVPGTKQELKWIVSAITNKHVFMATELRKTMKGLGTDEQNLNRIIVTRSEIDLGEIKEAFFCINHGKTLERWITDDTSGPHRDILLALVSGPAA